MKRTQLKAVIGLVAVVATLALARSASAAIAYDNTTTFLNNQVISANEIGDEITIAPTLGGGPQSITDFRFEYVVSPGFVPGAGIVAELKLYANDGPLLTGSTTARTPGTLLYDSGTIPLQAGINGFNNVTVSGLAVPLAADNFTWTVKFTGLAGAETAGLPLYNPPTVGSSFPDYWQNTGGSAWELLSFPTASGLVGNFGAQVAAVPEASTIVYTLIGILGLSGYRTLRRRSAQA
jgi:hypothetical protein